MDGGDEAEGAEGTEDMEEIEVTDEIEDVEEIEVTDEIEDVEEIEVTDEIEDMEEPWAKWAPMAISSVVLVSLWQATRKRNGRRMAKRRIAAA